MSARSLITDDPLEDFEQRAITLEGVGWKEFKSDDREGASDKILRCTGTFYVEKMSISIKRYDL